MKVRPEAESLCEEDPKGFWRIVRKWPKITFCIFSSEFCERFSYYGMRTVLTLYLINILDFNGSNSTALFHAFTVVAYSSPLLGSVLADGYIGKYWTILWVSLFYAAGQLILTYASTLHAGHSLHPGLDLLGLVVISVGTGGVKACVAAFGADQFPQGYVTMISVYFAVFYWTIQAGSTLSTVITPIFRTFSCMGQDTCYPLAFGVPAGLMLIATGALKPRGLLKLRHLAFFVSGSFWYKKIPPKENVIAKVFQTVWRAIRNRLKHGNARRKPHWMDHALDDHDCAVDKNCLTHGRCATASFVEDIKQLFRIVIMMLPVPVFWSLYDQQGSKWLLQAIAMDGRVTDGWTILPDQMSAANAILTMVFIPIFQFIVYPLVEACGFRITPLRKMVAGGVLASLCFVAAGSLQLIVNQTLPDPPRGHDAFLSVINGFSTDCSIVVDGIPGLAASRIIPRNSSLVDDKVAGILDLLRIQTDKTPVISPMIEFHGSCSGHSRVQYRLELDALSVGWLFVGPEGITSSTTTLDKPTKGEGESGLSLGLMMPCSHVPASLRTSANCPSDTSTYNGPLALCRVEEGSTDAPCNPRNPKAYYQWTVEETDMNVLNASLFTRNGDDAIPGSAVSYSKRDVLPGRYRLYYVNDSLRGHEKPPRNAEDLSAAPVGVEFEITGMGGVYLLVVSTDGDASDSNTTVIHTMHTVVPRNHMSILWQLPLYVIITMAETLFAISGYEFAYSQTAPSLKTVTQSIWLLTIGLGDAIIIVITLINTLSLATSDFIFAGGMLLVIGIFALMSVYYYDYVDTDRTKSDMSALVSREDSIKDEDRLVKL